MRRNVQRKTIRFNIYASLIYSPEKAIPMYVLYKPYRRVIVLNDVFDVLNQERVIRAAQAF